MKCPGGLVVQSAVQVTLERIELNAHNIQVLVLSQ